MTDSSSSLRSRLEEKAIEFAKETICPGPPGCTDKTPEHCLLCCQLADSIADYLVESLKALQHERDELSDERVRMEPRKVRVERPVVTNIVTAKPRPLSEPACECCVELQARLTAAEAEIERGLNSIKARSFIVDLAHVTSKKHHGGLSSVVDYSDAMHALLFVKQQLKLAVPTPETP